MLVYIKLLSSMIIWGATWVSGRFVAGHLEPFCAAFLRFFVASLFMVFMTMRMEGKPLRLEKAYVLPAFLLGLTGVFAYNAFFFRGLQVVEAGRAALIIAVAPTVIALFSRLLFKENIGRTALVGIPLSLCGVWVILSKGDMLSLLWQGGCMGDFFILGCVVSWSAYTLIGKRALRRMSPSFCVAWSCIFGDLMLLGPAVWQGLPQQVVSLEWAVWANIVFLGVLATGLAFYWYYQGVAAIGAGRAAVFINLVPVSGVLLGVLILGESVSLSLVVGGTLVLTGVWLTNRK
jgi:drug/metabolite transporter (DMT)-like permease